MKEHIVKTVDKAEKRVTQLTRIMPSTREPSKIKRRTTASVVAVRCANLNQDPSMGKSTMQSRNRTASTTTTLVIEEARIERVNK